MVLERELFLGIIYCLITGMICPFVLACDINVDALVTRKSAIDDKPLWTGKMDTVIACAQMCVRRKVCKSFNYDIISKKCDLNDVVIGDADTLRNRNTDMYSEIAYWPSSIDKCCYGRPCADSEVCIPGPLADGSGANDCKYACLKLSLVCPIPATGPPSGSRQVGAVNTYPCPQGQVGDSAECLPSQKWSKELSTTCQQILGHVCTSNSICSGINGECSGGMCACKSGSAYDAARAKCDCGPAPTVANAVATGDGFQQTYSCNSGYSQTAASVPTINCAASGWTPLNSFQCYTCGNAPTVPNAGFSGTDQQKTYSCNSGYTATSASTATINCGEDGQWQPQNSFACYTCGSAPAVPNANATGTDQQKTYSCNAGYTATSASTATINCGENGQWQPQNSFACYTCGSAPAVPNASATGTDLQKTYSCNAGYTATSGSTATINCGENGQWQPQNSFACYTCGSAPAVPNASATGTNLQKTYSCNSGYTATSGSTTTINCGEDGQWQPQNSFACYTCGSAPAVPNASATGPDLQKTYSCNSGYTTTSASTATINCGEDGQWQPQNSFACYTCGAAPVVPNASSSGTNNLQKTYTCDSGYTPVAGSNNTITCDESGQWQPQNSFSCEAPQVTNLRLAGSGDGISTGRLELFHNNQWNTVCRDDWKWEATQVVCKQLNPSLHIGGSSQRHSPWGQGTGTSYKLKHLSCTGSETSIFDCTYTTIQPDHCGHDKDMGVTCYTASTLNLLDSVRLVDGGSGQPLTLTPTPSGKHRLQVQWEGVWGSVCADPWREQETNVACKSLHTPLIGSDYCSDACDGQGTGTIFFGDLKCDGDEPHLFFCDNRGFTTNKCSSHSQTLALDCSG